MQSNIVKLLTQGLMTAYRIQNSSSPWGKRILQDNCMQPLFLMPLLILGVSVLKYRPLVLI